MNNNHTSISPLTTKDLDTIDLSHINAQSLASMNSLNGLTTVDLSTLSTNSIGAVGQGYTYTNTGTNLNWQSPNTVWTSSGTGAVTFPSGKPGTVELRGNDADLVVNGKSLMRLLERMEDRLNLLEPNTELEKDWDDLRRLGERYRKLEKKCKEKAETWKKLKAMPPPQMD